MLADFESGSYQGWTLHGDCFGSETASDTRFPGRIEGYGGSRFLCTLDPRRGTAARGWAVSAAFTIDRPALRFRIGGGCYPNEACLNLIVDGKIVRTETGSGCPALYPAAWDVSELRGRTARLEVRDTTTAADRGYIMVDDIVLGDPSRPAPPAWGLPPAEDDAGGEGKSGSTTLLKAFAALNATRRRARLPLLALDPMLMAAAQGIAAAQRAHEAAPVLPAGWQIGSLGAGGDGALSVEPGGKTVGLAAAPEAAEGSHRADWTVVCSREEPRSGDIVAVAVSSAGEAPAPGRLPGRADADVSQYGSIPVLPGWGGADAPDRRPTPRPTASASGLSVFPVLSGARWGDTFGAPRVGHTHQGEDLMAPKMRPLVACFSGTVALRLAASPQSTAGNTIHVTSADGWTAIYMHVNCDTPGTMDGRGGARYAFAPGLKTGDHVRAGQLLGYTGDSGNARGGESHCHFELHPPGEAAVNPTAALRAARVLHSPGEAMAAQAEPLAVPPPTAVTESDSLPGAGEIQIAGTLSAIAPDGLVLSAESVTLATGSPAPLTPPRLKAVCWSSSLTLPAGIKPGSRVLVVGRDSGPGTLLRATLLVFRR